MLHKKRKLLQGSIHLAYPCLSSKYTELNLRLAQSGTVGSFKYCSLDRDLVTTTSVAPKMAPPEEVLIVVGIIGKPLAGKITYLARQCSLVEQGA